MPSYTHYWTNNTCDEAIALGLSGERLDHVGDSRFSQRGVQKGDNIYVVTVRKGRLFLIGRLTVEKIVHSDAEARRLLNYEPWPAPDHLIAGEEACTPQRFDNEVPMDLVRQLGFESPDGPTALKFKSENNLDQQTLRGVRRLTPSSAAVLESLLK